MHSQSNPNAACGQSASRAAPRQPRLSPLRHPRFDPAERPFIVIWEVTRACDLACLHCRAEAAPWRHPAELTTEEGRALIDQVAAFGAPSPILIFTGGDPMKRADLVELVAYAAERELVLAFSPSATPALTPEVLGELHQAGLKTLSLSLDGSEPAIHDAFRGVEGVFARTMAAWDAAIALGFKVQINTTVTRRNLYDLPAIARMALEREVMTWSVFFLVPTGRGAALEQLSPAECEDVMHFLYDVGKALRTKTTEGHHYRRVVLQRTVLARLGLAHQEVLALGPTYAALRAKLGPLAMRSEPRRSPMDINAGRGFVFISHVGTVYPSGFFPAPAGSLRAATLQDIYRKSSLFVRLRDPKLLGGRCGRCEFASVCGGSRSRAYVLSGDPLAEDPLCTYSPGSFPFQAELASLLETSMARPRSDTPPAELAGS
jgi:radical SAM protein